MPGTDAPITEDERTSAIDYNRLVCADVDANNNKFWHGYVLKDGTYATEHGRVGESPATNRKSLGIDAAKKKLEADTKKKLNYKLPKKKPYVHQRTIAAGAAPASKGKTIAKSAVKQTAVKEIDFGGNKVLQKLLEWLADVNVHAVTSNSNIAYDVSSGTFSTELGVVTSDGIVDARKMLNDIVTATQKKNGIDSAKLKTLAAEYLQIVPQATGRGREWHRDLFGNVTGLRKQQDLLDSLDASVQQMTTAAKTKTGAKVKDAPRVFDIKLEVVEDSKKIEQVKRKYQADKGNHYDVATLAVKRVLKVEIASVKSAFVAHGKKIGNIKQLWHGTKASNLLSIFKGGLVIPPTSSGHVTGRMFGDGLYFSDQSSKSLRYATNAWSRGGSTDRTFMFLCEVAMGRSYKPSSYDYSLPKAGYDSTFAEGGRAVSNNEMIVYNCNQVNLIYLIEFTPHGR